MLPVSRTGTYTGNGSSRNISDVGFRPSLLIIWNETDGTARAEVIRGQAAASVNTILDTGSGDTDLAHTVSGGVTLHSRGFSVGNAGAVNTNNKVYRYIAIR